MNSSTEQENPWLSDPRPRLTKPLASFEVVIEMSKDEVSLCSWSLSQSWLSLRARSELRCLLHTDWSSCCLWNTSWLTCLIKAAYCDFWEDKQKDRDMTSSEADIGGRSLALSLDTGHLIARWWRRPPGYPHTAQHPAHWSAAGF